MATKSKINTPSPVNAINRRYFNSTKNYTLSLLNAFDNLYYHTLAEKNAEFTDNAYKVPITFGNYEKSIILEDVVEKDIVSGNINIIPRLVLSFNGMTKVPERQTQKYQTFSKKVRTPDGKKSMDMSYNSVAYDFQYTLLLQTRGLTMATQLVEQILSYFNPSMNLNIKEFPIFTDYTQTQIRIGDPEFEIIDEFEDIQTNIINVTFELSIRGNIYSNIDYRAPIEVVGLFTHVWDEFERGQSKMASYFKFDIDQDTGRANYETLRYFNGTMEYTDDVQADYDQMVENRPDFSPPEIQNKVNLEIFDPLEIVKEEEDE